MTDKILSTFVSYSGVNSHRLKMSMLTNGVRVGFNFNSILVSNTVFVEFSELKNI